MNKIILPILLCPNSLFANEQIHISWWLLFWQFVNVSIVLTYIIYKVRKPLAAYYMNSKISLQKSIKMAEIKMQDAINKKQEYEKKFNEIESLLAKMQKDSNEIIFQHEKSLNIRFINDLRNLQEEFAQRKVSEREKKVNNIITEILEKIGDTSLEKIDSNKILNSSVTESISKMSLN